MEHGFRVNQDDFLHVKKLKEGDKISFEYLFRKYEAKLYYKCLHFTRSTSDAEEVVQEVFVKIWEGRNNLDPDLSFSAYLIQIAKHSIYKKANKRMREFAYQTYHLQTKTGFSNETQEELNFRSTQKVITQIVENLPFMQRKVIMLSRFQGLSNDEIAERLHLSKSTVENHIHLALKTIKKYLLKQHLYCALYLMDLL
ncbi:RNA polymerase sigma-70 factor (ECF subfamily) [Catalinimonas alkaloidigena]|uniref:RNA polymerase sigma factor n=1 Tax=Catalinimonas alkaloidigena TaxID=1075417 RepID=UPI002405C5AC|nr:RNA polymerase sigma-70 factor [Catalinimonas alkaloidigena]MDF9797913.1 RNA polymerase sigma-70 factor (ECF subfamily) [Catalinimonas alkaloidigena]